MSEAVPETVCSAGARVLATAGVVVAADGAVVSAVATVKLVTRLLAPTEMLPALSCA